MSRINFGKLVGMGNQRMGSRDTEHQQECKRESAEWQMRSCHPSSAVLYQAPVCVVASPRASRLFRYFAFIIVDDVFVYNRVLILLTYWSNRDFCDAVDSKDLFVTIGLMTMWRTKFLIFLGHEFIMEISMSFEQT